MKHANNILAIIVIVILALSVFGALNVTNAPTMDAAKTAQPVIPGAGPGNTPSVTRLNDILKRSTHPIPKPDHGAVTPIPTHTSNRIGTKIDFYIHPNQFGVGLIPTLYAKSVPQGRWALVGIFIKAADKKYPCSPLVTCRVDGRVMGALIPPLPNLFGPPLRAFWPNGCQGSSVTPYTRFIVSGKDTARLSVGVHHLTVSYPGNKVYAPSTRTVNFLVSKAPSKWQGTSYAVGPFVGDKNSDVYYSQSSSCPKAHNIKPGNLVHFVRLPTQKLRAIVLSLTARERRFE